MWPTRPLPFVDCFFTICTGLIQPGKWEVLKGLSTLEDVIRHCYTDLHEHKWTSPLNIDSMFCKLEGGGGLFHYILYFIIHTPVPFDFVCARIFLRVPTSFAWGSFPYYVLVQSVTLCKSRNHVAHSTGATYATSAILQWWRGEATGPSMLCNAETCSSTHPPVTPSYPPCSVAQSHTPVSGPLPYFVVLCESVVSSIKENNV